MDCSKYYEMVSEEVDGELKESESLGLMRHLVKCSHCLSGYRSVLDLKESIKKDAFSSSLTVPPDFSKNIMELIGKPDSEPHTEFKEKKPSIADFISNLTELIKAPRFSYAFSVALSIMLIFSVSLIFKKSGDDNLAVTELTDAKTIKAEVLKPKRVARKDVDDLNYYVKRHSNVLARKAGPSPMNYGRSGFSHANFGSLPVDHR